MQQLFSQSPEKCRGVLLADDMGLGKTIQLLTLIAWCVEKFSEIPPALVVAPVSLLENWQRERDQFFHSGTLPIMTAYGDGLKSWRVPREHIDAELRDEGLVRFLQPAWRGNARIVLTTYETLRDLEFSFAKEQWSIMICDEAQKIKNPNAMVTRAAKKQNVRFRIACTGTPVENSLADLWCLHDFVQPGFLGALNEFGKDYGRPIEEMQLHGAEKLTELRAKIEPLLIRRTKKDVAKDLPRKIEVADCTVPMLREQRGYYIGAFQLAGRANGEGDGGRKGQHLGILQRLRLICADPRPYGVETFVPEDLRSYRLVGADIGAPASPAGAFPSRSRHSSAHRLRAELSVCIKRYQCDDQAFEAQPRRLREATYSRRSGNLHGAAVGICSREHHVYVSCSGRARSMHSGGSG